MRIAIASDHAALEMKAALVDWLQQAGHEVTDLGPMTADSVDYPDYGYKLASEVASGRVERGALWIGHRHFHGCQSPSGLSLRACI